MFSDDVTSMVSIMVSVTILLFLLAVGGVFYGAIRDSNDLTSEKLEEVNDIELATVEKSNTSEVVNTEKSNTNEVVEVEKSNISEVVKEPSSQTIMDSNKTSISVDTLNKDVKSKKSDNTNGFLSLLSNVASEVIATCIFSLIAFLFGRYRSRHRHNSNVI